MNKINPEIKEVNKDTSDLVGLLSRQLEVNALYKRRFSDLKRCLLNPVLALKFLIKYYKRNHWRRFKKELSPQIYTEWIKKIEESYQFVYEDTIFKGYVFLKSPGIVLSGICLSSLAKAIVKDPTIDLIYGDEDYMDQDSGFRSNPYFKPDYSPDTLLSFNYMGDFCLLRRDLLEDETLPIYDSILKACEKTDRICHIKRILFHKTKEYNPLTWEELRTIQEKALNRRGIKAGIKPALDAIGSHILYNTDSEPLVSVIIPSRDHFDVLKKCLDSLFSKTAYKNFEVILVDNGSKETCKQQILDYIKGRPITYLYESFSFNYSKMCNMGADTAKGDYLLFLNDDIEIINGDFLNILLGAASRQHVGAVGAKLIYPNGIIQHDGIIDIAAAPVHALHYGDDNQSYYFGRNRLDFNVSAVTGAVLMISADKFRQVKGFNEELAVGFNDIDLCYKLLERGYYNVLRNDAILIHHESLSRGLDQNDPLKYQRFLREQKHFILSHPGLICNDRFYHPMLTQTATDYSTRINDF